MDTPRDPHLPPPAACDWLLEQDWSEMIPITLVAYHGSTPHGMSQSKLYEYQQAHSAIGADGGGRILLSVEALDVLRKDQDNRRAALERPLPEPLTEPMDTPAPINIVLDGPPGPEAPRFIEVETDDGRSIRVGEWQERPDGRWALRIAALPRVPQDPDVDPETDLLQRILQECKNTELSAVHAVGILHSAALLMGSNTFPLMDPKIYDLIYPEQEER